jgi:hypothetical protein
MEYRDTTFEDRSQKLTGSYPRPTYHCISSNAAILMAKAYFPVFLAYKSGFSCFSDVLSMQVYALHVWYHGIKTHVLLATISRLMVYTPPVPRNPYKDLLPAACFHK